MRKRTKSELLCNNHWICRSSVSCRARSRTPLSLWRWTTAVTWTWTLLWLKCVLSMRTLLPAARLRQRLGTNRRWVKSKAEVYPMTYTLATPPPTLWIMLVIHPVVFFIIVWGDAVLCRTVWWWPAHNQDWDCWAEPHDRPYSEWDWGSQGTGIFQEVLMHDATLLTHFTV